MSGAPVRSRGEPILVRKTPCTAVAGAVRAKALELQENGFGEKPAHPHRIDPGGSAGISDEGDGTAHAEPAIQAGVTGSRPVRGRSWRRWGGGLLVRQTAIDTLVLAEARILLFAVRLGAACGPEHATKRRRHST